MKLELRQQLTLRERCEQLLDIIVEKIIDIGDFFIFRHITWTEAALFLYSIFRAGWFVIFGVENANYSYYFSDHVWTTVFVVMSLTHFSGFFIKSMCLRIAAGYMSAVVWTIMLILAAYSLTAAPAVPSLLPLIVLSVVVVVRLSHEHKIENE